MKRWAASVMTILLLLNGPINLKTSAVGGCSLCILEIGTASNLGEDYDFAIIGNVTNSSMSLSSIQLQYLNSLGVLDSKINLSGTLLAGQVKIFASEQIKTFNPSASSLTFNIYSGGGSLRLIKVLVASTTIYDTVGWGGASLVESSAVNNSTNENHFARKIDNSGIVLDTNSNINDFEKVINDCSGLYINEIQPFATDGDGQAVKSWVEFVHENQTLDNCSFVSNSGAIYDLSPDIYGDVGNIFSVDSFVKDGIAGYLELPNPSGIIATAIKSVYLSSQPLLIPIYSVAYGGLVKGQTYSRVIEYGNPAWRATYTPTEGEENINTPDPQVLITGFADACEGIVINEIMPNPSGSDTGHEWLEILNTNPSTKGLGQCVISVEDEKYYFSENMNIGAGEYQKYQSLYSESGDEKELSLRNTDPTLVAMSRLYAGELTSLQSFIYEDAPEAMTYSRFETGWAWTYTATPELANIYQPTKPTPIVTESKANFSSSTSTSIYGATNSVPIAAKSSAKASIKKSTASTKSLSTTAKSATGAKTVNSERDLYQEPDKLESSGNGGYVFVLIGVMAVIYAMYEYKTDIQNYFLKRRRIKELRGEDRQAA